MVQESNNLKLLNLGCGSHYHPAWINVDLLPAPSIISHNLLNGIPFSKEQFDVVYHSHLLEHFPRSYAGPFLKECHRVLKSNGIIRIAVPNLEKIHEEYQKWFKLALLGDKSAQANYEWIMLEMYDQTVRRFPGGQMGEYLKSKDIPNKDYILSRLGQEAEKCWILNNSVPSLLVLIKQLGPRRFMSLIRERLACIFSQIIGGPHVRLALEEGLFRRSGEIHQWMYDRLSLKNLLEDIGFTNVEVCQAEESRIPGFNEFGLDIENGRILKPDSLFIEAIKP